MLDRLGGNCEINLNQTFLLCNSMMTRQIGGWTGILVITSKSTLIKIYLKFSRATNMNCTLLTGKSLDTTPAEMMTFFGMNLMMSCLRYPSMRMYWIKSLRVPRLSESMSRNRFFRIRSFLKVVID